MKFTVFPLLALAPCMLFADKTLTFDSGPKQVTLEHDFIVVKHAAFPANPVANGFGAKVEPGTFFKSIEKAGEHALAVWVEDPNSLKPVQATGGWLEPLPAN